MFRFQRAPSRACALFTSCVQSSAHACRALTSTHDRGSRVVCLKMTGAIAHCTKCANVLADLGSVASRDERLENLKKEIRSNRTCRDGSEQREVCEGLGWGEEPDVEEKECRRGCREGMKDEEQREVSAKKLLKIIGGIMVLMDMVYMKREAAADELEDEGVKEGGSVVTW